MCPYCRGKGYLETILKLWILKARLKRECTACRGTGSNVRDYYKEFWIGRKVVVRIKDFSLRDVTEDPIWGRKGEIIRVSTDLEETLDILVKIGEGYYSLQPREVELL